MLAQNRLTQKRYADAMPYLKNSVRMDAKKPRYQRDLDTCIAQAAGEIS